jgi:hypothetical protein
MSEQRFWKIVRITFTSCTVQLAVSKAAARLLVLRKEPSDSPLSACRSNPRHPPKINVKMVSFV